ncbi:MAG: NAD(P)-dependent oxidoreductase [Nitrospirota bacterium]|nr:NAD(P)-dependent oxidoreductase [Nitrospirota bacterium]
MEYGSEIIGSEDPILITGAAGFIGLRLVENLIERGFRNLRCFVRSSSSLEKLETIAARYPGHSVEIITGNLLSRSDCATATRDVAVIFHLAAGTGEKSFPDAFMNSVVATRNLLEAALKSKSLRRFVNVSSFTVYTNEKKPRGRFLDESCPIEEHPELRGDAYCFAKVKQDELVSEYGKKYGIPYVIVRPGAVYGPGTKQITGRVGLGTFGVFLHMGGSNRIPFTYVDNCVDAIVLAGLKRGIDGEVFNVVDDELPSSRRFLKLYKQNVRRFRSIYVPGIVSYLLCIAWEKYANWSEGQLPPVFNRKRWHVEWKKTNYSNEKLKERLGWTPRVSMTEGLKRFFESCREKANNA